jgi:hypothetical protein
MSSKPDYTERLSMKIRCALLLALLGLCCWLIAPAVAQNSALTTVSFNGINVTYDAALMGAVYPQAEAAVPPDPKNPMPAGAVTPAYNALTFFQPSSDHGVNLYTAPMLRVYTTADIQALGDPYYAQTLAALQQLVTQPDSAGAMMGVNPNGQDSMPYLPAIEATQVMRMQPQFIQTRSVSGVRYFTYYSQSADPITDGQIWYTFQGLAANGAAYVAFTAPVMTGVLPSDISANFDYNAFSADYTNFLQTTFDTLNSADANTFSPSVSALDAFISSISIRY